MAKIDIDKFVASLMEFSPQQSMKYIKALADQGLKYKDGEIVEIEQEQPSEKDKDYEDLSIINEGDYGVLLYFTKNGRGISDFRISKDTARWLHGRLGEYLEMYDDEEPIEEISEDLRKRYERIGKSDWFKKTHEDMSITIPDGLKGTDTDGGVVGEKGEEGVPPKFNRKRLEEVAKPETFEEKVEHWQRMRKIAEDRVKELLKDKGDDPEYVGMKELGKIWEEQSKEDAILTRLDRIYDLLLGRLPVFYPNNPYPYTPPIIYKRPLVPDPNILGGWNTTASTEGGEE